MIDVMDQIGVLLASRRGENRDLRWVQGPDLTQRQVVPAVEVEGFGGLESLQAAAMLPRLASSVLEGPADLLGASQVVEERVMSEASLVLSYFPQLLV